MLPHIRECIKVGILVFHVQDISDMIHMRLNAQSQDNKLWICSYLQFLYLFAHVYAKLLSNICFLLLLVLVL